MRHITLCFQVHHPLRFKKIRYFDIGNTEYYYDDRYNEHTTCELTENYYLPANDVLHELIKHYKGRLKIAFYISGTSIDQFFMYAPDVIESYRELIDTGYVEILGVTRYHSLASVNNKNEFCLQVHEFQERCKTIWGQKPTVFANTNLIYSDNIGATVAELGYKGIFANGTRKLLGWRSPNYLYSNHIHSNFKIVLRNQSLSDELEWMLTETNKQNNLSGAERFFRHIKAIGREEPIINLFLNYRSLGGLFGSEKLSFITEFIHQVLNYPDYNFCLPSDLVRHYGTVAEINCDQPSIWANEYDDFKSCLSNDLQTEALKQLYHYQEKANMCNNIDLVKDWQYLQTSDHFFYMNDHIKTKESEHFSDNPYSSPYDAFINYMNILNDFGIRLNKYLRKKENKGKKLSPAVQSGANQKQTRKHIHKNMDNAIS